ncbi:MAG: ankyrin repeat domain-containing protein [Rickettsia sp.]|nr:ankyrin repeat domain-containing protein [Rickettsia sp.]
MNSLEKAINRQEIEIVKAILKHKDIDVNAMNEDGETYLSFAVRIESVKIVKMLFDK